MKINQILHTINFCSENRISIHRKRIDPKTQGIMVKTKGSRHLTRIFLRLYMTCHFAEYAKKQLMSVTSLSHLQCQILLEGSEYDVHLMD